MRRRAERVDETRLRITEAAMRLHTTVGPSNTSISTVAVEAGVTRLTVYRHFKNQDELFDACRRHWYTTNPPPDASAWRSIPHLEGRARRAFAELYRWYGEHGEDLYPIYRDMASMPQSAQDDVRTQWAAVADALVDGVAVAPRAVRRLRAVAGHLIGLPTWRSFVVEQGLTEEEAVDVAVRLLGAAALVDEADVAAGGRGPVRSTRHGAAPGVRHRYGHVPSK